MSNSNNDPFPLPCLPACLPARVPACLRVPACVPVAAGFTACLLPPGGGGGGGGDGGGGGGGLGATENAARSSTHPAQA